MSTPIGQEPQPNEPSLSPSQRQAPRMAHISGNHELPRWESFTLQDRRLLIRLIVQMARRQVHDSRMQQGEIGTR